MALFSLGKYHEALLEFSLSAVLGENLHKLKSKINEVLQKLLIIYNKENEASGLESWSPIYPRYLKSYLNTFISGSNKFEDNTVVLKKVPFNNEYFFIERKLYFK